MPLKDNLYLLELFHGPTFAFKDVALQFLGNLFEYFLVRRNEGKTGRGMSECWPGDITNLTGRTNFNHRQVPPHGSRRDQR